MCYLLCRCIIHTSPDKQHRYNSRVGRVVWKKRENYSYTMFASHQGRLESTRQRFHLHYPTHRECGRKKDS